MNFVLDVVFAAPCHPSGLTNQQRLAVLENLPRWVNWRIEFADQNGGPAAARAEVVAMKASRYAAMLSKLADETLAAHLERAGNRMRLEEQFQSARDVGKCGGRSVAGKKTLPVGAPCLANERHSY